MRRGGRQSPMKAQPFTPKEAADMVQGPDVRLGNTVLLFNKPDCLSPVLR